MLRQIACACLLLAVLLSTTIAAAADASPAIRVMSFNVRYAKADDGANGWDLRKSLLAETIHAFDPDLLGTQEVLAVQADYLVEQLPGYKFVGVGRDDGKRRGEFSPIMFKSARFELLDSGAFWLSEHPDQPGSKSWDTVCTRIVTWAKLRDLKAPADGPSAFIYLNTHWDHVGVVARAESANLMRAFIADKATDLPVLVSGDFNSTETSPQYAKLLEGGAGPKLVDCYRAVHPGRCADEASFHDFKGGRQGMRIDWILASGQFTPLQAAIDATNRDGRYPSDHFAVTSVIRWKEAAANVAK